MSDSTTRKGVRVTSSRWLAVIASSVLLALGVAACGSSNNGGTAKGEGTINGAGATFPQPVYSEWANQQ
jgi:ABC-type phosphate transport system substrate-binding protein